VDVEAITHHVIGPIVFQLTTLSIFTELALALAANIFALFTDTARNLAALPIAPSPFLIQS
jgi:hypothetical protein